MLENLKTIPFFSELTDDDLQKIADHIQPLQVAVGQMIFSEGEVGDKMYVIVSGTVQVIRKGEVITLLKPGHFFGEMALVSDEPRNASIKVVEPVQLLTLNKEDFTRLMDANRNIASKVSYEVVKRANQIF